MNLDFLPEPEKIESLFDAFINRERVEEKSRYCIKNTSEPKKISSGEDKKIIDEPSAYAELMALTGLTNVKEAIQQQINYHKIMMMRRAEGKQTPKRLMHLILTGNPGTGKTTVARLIGRIFRDEGILSSGHLIEANRASLVGQWLGETEKKTSEILKTATGGILFIDEIYSLTEPDNGQISTRDFGMKVIDTLMPYLSNPDSDVMIIGAGYPDKIRFFLKSNPGLASRFPTILEFKDFTIDELMHIAKGELKKYDFIISDEAEEELRKLLEKAVKIKNHGNARMVMTIVNNYMIPNLCDRLVNSGYLKDSGVADSSLIIKEDLPEFNVLFPLSDVVRGRIGY